MTDILWIDPVAHADFSGDIQNILRSVGRPNTNVDVAALDRGPHHLEYHYYESLVTPDVLHKVKHAENEGYDASIIGCFYDLALEEAREVSDMMPIAAPAEATTHLATTLGDSFSVVVGRQKWVPQMRDRVRKYGFGEHLTSFRTADLGILDFQANPETTERRLREAATAAVEEDNAEVVILGCTAEYGFYEDLQADLGVPVLDAVTAPFKFAELLADLATFGWTQSKAGEYESPPLSEISDWGIKDDYENANVWTQGENP
ncbi:hydantoin racemase [Halorubrum persicum]|uniref:Hydantoin racemase n=1 Tax=Halorubrum persicum TaxID=1383844 RepID=A0A2G1WFX4_9EURY|nr:aspartate/glutamate racemase family protein [Halorubrum persicum]PHQ37883.1 hydantoin racemase [Halorubrum persicum]